MPYNTTAIPPRREATGQTQLPLSRVKKIIAQDPDINMCSNNAAFIITLATEMFVQHLAGEAHNQAKMDRKPRRNLQYKDFSNSVALHENLEFLQDVVPKTVPFKQIKDHAALTRAKLRGEKAPEDPDSLAQMPNGKRQKSMANGDGAHAAGHARGPSDPSSMRNGFHASLLLDDDPSSQLEAEMRAANGDPVADQDVDMTG